MDVRGRLIGALVVVALILAGSMGTDDVAAVDGASTVWQTSTPLHCGHFVAEVASIDHLEARGVSCRLARRLARIWFDVSAFPVPHATSVLGFSCVVVAQDLQYAKVRCLRAPLLVQWETT
jgi:hypothetical protein